MADVKHPVTGSVLSVPDDSVDRYKAAGWTTVEKKAPTRKRAASKSDK